MSRINAVNVLSDNLALFPDVAEFVPIKSAVDQFYLELDGMRDHQESTKAASKVAGTAVETQRINAGIGQYYSLCFLLNKYKATPDTVAAFFELDILRNATQTHFTGTIAPATHKNIMTHTFYDEDQLSLEVTNANPNAPPTAMTFYLASTLNGTDSTPVVVQANAAKILLDASAFGVSNYPEHRYLNVVNDTAFELHFDLELID